MKENRDEITALQVLYSRPYRERLTFEQVKELAAAIEKPPHGWTPERLARRARRSTVHACAAASSASWRTSRWSLRPARGRGTRRLPRARPRTLPGVAPPAGERRPRVPPGATRCPQIAEAVATSLGVTVEDFAYAPFVQRERGVGAQSRCSATSWACCWASSTSARVVSALPSGWARTTVGEIARPEYGGSTSEQEE